MTGTSWDGGAYFGGGEAPRERDDLHRMWKLYRQKQLDAALAGPYGGILGRLIAFLNGMTFEKGAAALIDHVRAEDWHSTDADTRFLALCIVSEAIMRLRKRAGLPEIDDGLPGERPNAFVIIREILR